MDDGDRIRDRATVDRYEPPVYGLEEPTWVAEDPETGCVGLGRVEAEAVGNLVAVVLADGRDPGTARVKLPGRTIDRSWDREDAGGGPLSWLRDRLR